jgi:hypothetical protein|tara:strand:- start:1050 stop:1310 length:261 start_codon:yes stop_codon:yes gene_type:complete
VATKETIIPSENLSVTSDKKVEQIALIGETKTMTTSKVKATKSQSEKLTLNMIATADGLENEREPEELAFDDETGVDYDLDYTTQA